MSVTLQSLGLDRLSLDDKIDLMNHLWDDIAASVPPGGLLTDAQRQALWRRVEDARANPDDSIARGRLSPTRQFGCYADFGSHLQPRERG